jgi:hypothetical protein
VPPNKEEGKKAWQMSVSNSLKGLAKGGRGSTQGEFVSGNNLRKKDHQIKRE